MARRITSDHLALGRSTVLERRVGKVQRRAKSTIIGVREPSYLIVDLPFVNGRPIPAPDDKQCIVRLVSEGSAIGFRAKVARTYLEPFPMAILLYPPEFQEVPVRQADRVACSIVATLMPVVDTPAGTEAQRAEAAQQSPPPPEAKKADSSSRTRRKNAASAAAPPPRPEAPFKP
jgi:c-di-GMP-binding flagellar brake protein YcgR